MGWLIFDAVILFTATVVGALLVGERRAEARTETALLRARRELAQANTKVLTQHQEIRALNDARIDLRKRNRYLASLVLDPLRGDNGGCHKIPLRDRTEADQFARLVEAANADGAELESYRCKECPRHPVTLAHVWHITHVDPELRGQEHDPAKTTAPAPPTRIAMRVTPKVMSELRKRVQQSSGEDT